MKEKIINIIKLVVLMLLFFNIGNIFRLILLAFNINVNSLSDNTLIILDAIMESTLVIVVISLYSKELINSFKEYKLNFKENIRKTFVYFGVFLAVKFGSAFIESFLAILLDVELSTSDNQSIIQSFTSSLPLVMLLSSSFLAPIVEEGIFRLGLGKLFSNKYLFMTLSALIFGFMHIFPTDASLSLALIQSITYVACGMCLAYMYIDSNNIYHGIFNHALNNLLSIIVIIFSCL